MRSSSIRKYFYGSGGRRAASLVCIPALALAVHASAKCKVIDSFASTDLTTDRGKQHATASETGHVGGHGALRSFVLACGLACWSCLTDLSDSERV